MVAETYRSSVPTDMNRDALRELWRRCITMDRYDDPTDAVVAELSEFFSISPAEARQRCLNWEQDSVVEWKANDRSTAAGLLDFYQQQTSWIFDTLWYHANQYHQTAPAESVEIAWGLRRLQPGQHLDFGAGPGTSSIFFHHLGWNVALADISTTFQDFARWRLLRHGIPATFYDTSREELPTAAYDLITAFDVMVHVADVETTLHQLHRALKPGGYLVFNIDNLPCTERTVWNLYADQYPILGKVRRTGFRRHPKITYFHVYQKVERSSAMMRSVEVYDALRYNRYVTTVGNRVRWLKRQISRA